ncbi:MAG: phosphatase PAP2 family protein [Acidobacteriota bacterium]
MPTFRTDERGRLSTYLRWSLGVAVAFLTTYPTVNWLTSLRSWRLHLYLPGELAIPFVPELVWAYASLYALFVMPLFFLPAERIPALGRQLMAGSILSGVCFLLFPAELGFVRELPTAELYAWLFSSVFRVDHPYNLVPSLHVLYSATIVLACADHARPLARVLLWSWLALIAVSTVLIHQHHLLDLAVAFALVPLLRRRDPVG